jgi:DegV family protein with EDD domain
VLIVTDGAVDIPEDLMASDLVTQVPGEIWGTDRSREADREEFWAGLRRGEYPSTGPPTVSALMSAYQHPDLVIALHVSGQLSATVQRAQEAAERLGSGVSVIDTGSFSVGAGLIVSEVHRVARSESAPSLLDLARSLPQRLHTFALVQDVDALRRSDRSGLLPRSHLARNHPMVLAIHGRVVPLAQPKQRTGALIELAQHLRHRPGSNPRAWALGHGDAADVSAVVNELSKVMDRDPAFVTYLYPTVGVHLGPDSLVVGVLSDPISN